jgi:hypothetical protein
MVRTYTMNVPTQFFLLFSEGQEPRSQLYLQPKKLLHFPCNFSQRFFPQFFPAIFSRDFFPRFAPTIFPRDFCTCFTGIFLCDFFLRFFPAIFPRDFFPRVSPAIHGDFSPRFSPRFFFCDSQGFLPAIFSLNIHHHHHHASLLILSIKHVNCVRAEDCQCSGWCRGQIVDGAGPHPGSASELVPQCNGIPAPLQQPLANPQHHQS